MKKYALCDIFNCNVTGMVINFTVLISCLVLLQSYSTGRRDCSLVPYAALVKLCKKNFQMEIKSRHD